MCLTMKTLGRTSDVKVVLYQMSILCTLFLVSQVFQPNAMAPTLRSGKRLRSPTPPAASTSRTPRRRRMSVSEETLEETSGEPTDISGESSEISSQAS